MPSLLDMPDLAMNLILGSLNFRSIQNLRKSCRDLRHFIDDVKPESRSSQIYIQQDLYAIHLSLDIDHQNFNIIYQKWDDGCKVKRHGIWERILQNADYVDVAIRDIQLILDSQKSGIVEKFEVYLIDKPGKPKCLPNVVASKLTENLQRILEPKSLKVKKFKITFGCQENVMSFLPFLNADTLEHIILRGRREKSEFDLIEISKLEQWKNAKGLKLVNFTTDLPISNFAHFQIIFMEAQTVTLQMILELKEMFFKNNIMKFFEIGFPKYDFFETQLIEFFGEPRRETMPRKREWFFRIPEDSQQLLLFVFASHVFLFRRIRMEEVPVNAVNFDY